MMPGISVGAVRGLITLVLMLAFIGMVIYVYSKRNRKVYEDAALLPLEGDTKQSTAADVEQGSQRS